MDAGRHYDLRYCNSVNIVRKRQWVTENRFIPSKAEITKMQGRTGETEALYKKYEQKVNDVIRNNVYEWTISPVESQVAVEVALNNERAIIYLNKIVAELNKVKAEFDNEIKTVTVMGVLNITVTVSAIQTVTGTKITDDKQVTMEYEKLQ